MQVPEPVSPRYRSRVLKVSCRCRSHSVKHVPEPHSLMPQEMRHECAMIEDATTVSSAEDGSDQALYESGRRESNPRSQLGKLMFCR